MTRVVRVLASGFQLAPGPRPVVRDSGRLLVAQHAHWVLGEHGRTKASPVFTAVPALRGVAALGV